MDFFARKEYILKKMISPTLAMLIRNVLNLEFIMIAAMILSYDNFNDYYTTITFYLIRDDITGIRLLESLTCAVISSATMAITILFINLYNIFLYTAMGIVVYSAIYNHRRVQWGRYRTG